MTNICKTASSILWISAALSQRRFISVINKSTSSAALESARLYTDALAEFRTMYTSEVVERLRPLGVKVTHDYRDTDGAIPLPATMSMMLGGMRMPRQPPAQMIPEANFLS